MSYENFFFLFINNFWFNLCVVFATIIFYLLIFKKNIYSIFDPLFFYIFFSSAGKSVVFILFLSGYITSYYLYQFLLTEVFFILGFLVFKPISFKKMHNANIFFSLRITKRIKILYFISGVLYILSNLVIYILKGIPLFMTSRLNATTGGYGFALSISVTTGIIVLSILCYKLLLKFRYRLFDYVMFFLFLVFSILSGSKAVFLGIIFILFYVVYFLSVKMSYPQIIKKFNRISAKFAILASITSIVILFMKHLNPFLTIGWRILMGGDAFMMSYVNNNIEMIKGNFLTLSLPFRIVDILNLHYVKPIGEQLTNIIYGTDINAGPNALYNILGYVSFGYWGSLIFSFFIGILVGFLRNKLIKLLKLNLESLIIFVLILYPALSLPADFNFGLFQYISELIVFIIIYSLSVIFSYEKSKTIQQNTKTSI